MSEDIIKILVSILLGGILGIEREIRNRSAGLRTLILICVGSTLLTIISINFSRGYDPLRLAANIITGIGFLGAGAIFREAKQLQGLTTASSIWVISAVGICVGVGYYHLAILVTILSVVILTGFNYVEHYIENVSFMKNYEINLSLESNKNISLLVEKYTNLKGVVKLSNVDYDNNNLKINLLVKGSKSVHSEFIKQITQDEKIVKIKM